jgi:hypothetical protein
VVRVAARTKQRSQDIARLLRENYTAKEIALITNYPLGVVESHVREIERHNEAMAEFQRTGQMPSSGGYYAIFQP